MDDINQVALNERVEYLCCGASQSMELHGTARVVHFSWPIDGEASLLAGARLEAMGWKVMVLADRFLATPPEAG
jgi:hypothetical protein